MKKEMKKEMENKMKEMKEFKLDEKSILVLSKKDMTAYTNGNKSYELNNWLKDELVIQSYLNAFKPVKATVSCKAFARIVNLIAYFRENNILSDNTITILDRETVEFTFKIELDNLDNRYRRYLNLSYEIVELPYLDNKDEEVEDYDRVTHSF